jgi:hypothetical protein
MIASGRPDVVVCRVRVTPSASASTMKTPTAPGGAPSAADAGGRHEDGVGHQAAGTQALVPLRVHEPSACAVAVVAGLGAAGEDDLSRQLGHGGGEDRLAAGSRRAARLARCASVPNWAIGAAP